MGEHSASDDFDFDELYPGRFLKGGLLKAPTTYTIKRVGTETMTTEKGDTEKPVIAFAETALKWIPCKTDGICLRSLWGRKSKAWVGHRVTLHFDPKVKFGKETKGGIRMLGSPELTAVRPVEVNLQRRAAFTVDLQPTGPGRGSQAVPAPAPTQIGPAQKWLNASAALGYDADTAKAWARDLRGCEWETPWTPEHVQVCGAAIEQAKATAAAVAAGTQREPGVD